jgi:hypothetical protein
VSKSVGAPLIVALIVTFLAASASIASAMTKAEEFARIDPSITAEKLVGNPQKYAGKYVKLHCTVHDVQSDGSSAFANADCGQEDGPLITVYGSITKNFDAGQAINFIGWVKGGVSGEVSGSGGEMQFATVRYDYAL